MGYATHRRLSPRGQQLVIRMAEDLENSPPDTATKSGAQYTDSSSVPFISFDGVACHGTLHGIIEIELAARIMAPLADGGVQTKFVPTGRLRCSPTAAAALRQSIDVAMQMAEQPQQQPPAAGSKLN
jgi:hypothetical protein